MINLIDFCSLKLWLPATERRGVPPAAKRLYVLHFEASTQHDLAELHCLVHIVLTGLDI
jgi:hypothetical protein